MSWMFFALLSAVFAAAVGILGKVGLKTVDSTLATAVRSAIMAVFLVSIALTLGKFRGLDTLAGKPIMFIALSGISGALSWLCYFFALKYGPASTVAALDKLSVVFVVILAAIFLGESFTWKTALGAVFITVGALLFVFK
jgi:transporter family protein